MEDVCEFLSEVESCLASIMTEINSTNHLDNVLQEVEWLLRDVVLVEEILPQPHGETLIQAVSDVYVSVQNEIDAVSRTQMRGHPSYDISEEHLTALLDHHFKTTDIARLFNVSARTIRRRIIQYGLEEVVTYSKLSDTQLDDITQSFVHHHPHSGRRSYDGFLRSVGLRVQQTRVRESLLRVDRRGVENRFRRALHRRQYSVRMPNSLWHIDGYHKLIHWRIVIHGGIDGYSRLPVFLRASTNNRAETVLDCFLTGVQQFGLPSRVRCDKGGENVRVSEYMLNHPRRGPGRRSCITGRSVHNQRIERFWRDLYPSCISLYYVIFCSLEDAGMLDTDSSTDMFYLHFIFVPRINNTLSEFRESYGHHRLRTAGNKTPYQLWISGITQTSEDATVAQGVQENSISVRNKHY